MIKIKLFENFICFKFLIDYIFSIKNVFTYKINFFFQFFNLLKNINNSYQKVNLLFLLIVLNFFWELNLNLKLFLKSMP